MSSPSLNSTAITLYHVGRARLGFLVALLFSAVLAKVAGYLPELSWWLVTSPGTVGVNTAIVVQLVRLAQAELRKK